VLSDERRSAELLHTQLGIGVDISAPGDDLLVHELGPTVDLLGQAGVLSAGRSDGDRESGER